MDKHSLEPGHGFTKHARITRIEKIENTRMTKQELTLTLETREDFWIKTLDTLKSYGSNQTLNFREYINDISLFITVQNLTDVIIEGIQFNVTLTLYQHSCEQFVTIFLKKTGNGGN